MRCTVTYNLWKGDQFDMNAVMHLFSEISKPVMLCEGIALTAENNNLINDSTYGKCSWSYDHIHSIRYSILVSSTSSANFNSQNLCSACISSLKSLRQKKRIFDVTPSTRSMRMRILTVKTYVLRVFRH